MFQLAEALHRTVAEIGRMDSRELSEWLAYFRVKEQMRQKAETRREAERGLAKERQRGFRR